MSLTLEELVEHAGLGQDAVIDLVRIGVTRSDASFEPGDVQRVITAAAFLDAGFTLEQLASAIAAHTISFEFADALDLEPVERSGTTLADLAARLAEPVDLLRTLYGAFGLPLPSADTALRGAEEEVVTAFVEAWRVAGPEATVRAARIFGDGARRASEGWVDLFVEQVSLPAMSRYATFQEYAEGAIRPATELAKLAPRLLVWLQLRHTSHAMLAANLRHFERDLVARDLIPAPEHGHPVIAFADLVGFTALTEAEGNARAVEAAAQLQVIAEAAATSHAGRVVKLLGDGALLRFRDVAAAAFAMLEVARAVPQQGLGAAHLGLERGAIVERDGDVFGSSVNLAARIAGSAGAGELLVGPAAAEGLHADPRFVLTPLGEREFKGFGSPVPVWRAQSAAS